jgi:dephospho-CoA kinase
MNRIEDVKSEWHEGKIRTESAVPVVVLEAAVLLDAEWDDILDGVWVVKAPKEVALRRLMETRGLSQDESEKRIQAQQSRRGIGNLEEEIQNKVVTNVIENSGSLEDLRNALEVALRDPKSWK